MIKVIHVSIIFVGLVQAGLIYFDAHTTLIASTAGFGRLDIIRTSIWSNVSSMLPRLSF